MEIFKEFQVEAAHRLPNVPEEHKCRRLHGHSYRIAIHVRGPVGTESGWVVDFAEIARAFAPLRAEIDHRVLNDIEGLSNPTAENLARWIWRRILPKLPGLAKVVVCETPTSGVVYVGEES